MAGTCTYSFVQNRRLICSWTSDAAGAVSGSTCQFTGTIVRVVTNPGATAPTDNYDLVMNDADGIDVFAGQGANRDTANSEHFVPGVPFSDGTTTSVAPVYVDGSLELQVSNAGDSKVGVVTIYFR